MEGGVGGRRVPESGMPAFSTRGVVPARHRLCTAGRRQQARPPGASAYLLCWPQTCGTTTCARDRSSTTLPRSNSHHHHQAGKTPRVPGPMPTGARGGAGPREGGAGQGHTQPRQAVLTEASGEPGEPGRRSPLSSYSSVPGSMVRPPRPPSTGPKRARASATGYGCVPAPGPPRHAPRAQPPPDSASTRGGPGPRRQLLESPGQDNTSPASMSPILRLLHDG